MNCWAIVIINTLELLDITNGLEKRRVRLIGFSGTDWTGIIEGLKATGDQTKREAEELGIRIHEGPGVIIQ